MRIGKGLNGAAGNSTGNGSAQKLLEPAGYGRGECDPKGGPLRAVRTAPLFGLFLFLFVFVSSCPAGAALVPRALLKWSGLESEHAVVVDKEAQEVWVFHKGESIRPTVVFPCSTGENGGPKQRKNDRKTPEGVYFFTQSYTEKDLSSTYGVRAYPIDYPNPLDRLEGRGGYGIWFHGTNKMLKPRDTNGCVVLENHSIETLSRYIRLRRTPVIITDKIEWVEDAVRRREAAGVEESLERWRSAWERGDLDAYIGAYAGSFNGRGMDLAAWKRYKAGLFMRYKKIRVRIEGLELFQVNGVVLAKFHQIFQGNGFTSSGEKRLYLAKNSASWKIVGEFFKEGKRAVSPVNPLEVKEEIARFVRTWRRAWEDKDLDAYMACYDSSFRSRGMNRSAWRRYKAGLNRKYGKLRVLVEGRKIRLTGPGRATVRFRQRYVADTYEDYGRKVLLLVKRGKRWKIRRETWKKIAENGNANRR